MSLIREVDDGQIEIGLIGPEGYASLQNSQATKAAELIAKIGKGEELLTWSAGVPRSFTAP